MDGGRSMRAMETTPAASLNASEEGSPRWTRAGEVSILTPRSECVMKSACQVYETVTINTHAEIYSGLTWS
jgi:hypothetical protein